MPFKKRTLLFVIVFGIFVLIGLVRSKHLFEGIILDYFVFCVFTILVCYRFKSKLKPLATGLNVIISIVIALFIANLIDNSGNIFNRSMYIFPGTLMVLYAVLGAFTGALLYQKSTRIFGVILFVLMSVLFVTKGKWIHDKWMHYVAFSNFGTIASETIDFAWEIQHHDTIISNQNDSLEDTYLILDFWNAGCINCMRAMPTWDSLSQVTFNMPTAIIPVFIPYRGDTKDTAYDLLKKHDIKYLTTAFGTQDMLQDFKVRVFPTVIILKDNVIYFRGNKDEGIKWLKNNGVL